MDYLKDEQHYIDRYDLHTIEECLDYYWSIRDRFAKEKDTHFAKYTQEKFEQEMNKCLNLVLFTMKGQRYLHKKETIQEWMDRDRRMQEIYDNTPAPQNVLCKICSSPTVVTHKDLHNSYEPTARMMFMFECTKCKKRQSLFEDGTEWKYDPPKCPKCKHVLKTDLKIKGDISTFTSTCSKCGYKDKDVSDHKKWKEELEAKEKKDKELLEKYREEFCLSDKEGKEHVETLEAMEVANIVHDEEMQKYDDPVYERVSKLKRTTIVDLEKLLTGTLEKAKYTELSFEKPEIGQYVIVPFTLQDSNSSRRDRISVSELEKLIKVILEDTNWRLLSNSVMYRLGYIEGRLKGYEREEDMLRLAGKTEGSTPKPKIDEEKRQKYASNNLVQLARMTGKYDGIEKMRKRRLKNEPEGFFLEASEGPLTCSICGEHYYGNEMWWNLDGTRCKDCWRNIKEGVVPSLKPRFDDKSNWFESWQIKSNHGVHPSSVRKLVREGVLHSRDLKRKDGTVYYTVYLVSENQEFLKKYPKKKSSIKMTIQDSKGNEAQL